MAESLKQNEKELNDLLVVFWKLRHDAGASQPSIVIHNTNSPDLPNSDVYMDLLANEILVNELEED